MRAFCPACCSWQDTFILDRQGNPRGCTRCESLERHRVLALLIPAVAAVLAQERDPTRGQASSLVVDVAPSRSLDPALSRLPGSRVVRMDFDPAADGRAVDVRASVTAMPLADRSVDLLICSHVLEHVPDDHAAMVDIARVLDERGLAVVVVPWRPGPTDEDPGASVEERVRRFGQADHVRYYGEDFDDRLATAGLAVETFRSDELVEPWVSSLLKLLPSERFWLVRPAGSAEKLPTVGELRGRLGHELTVCLSVGSVDGQAAAREQAALWQSRYRKLRARRTVRLLFAVSRTRTRIQQRLRTR